jgi:hypothetical protein
MSDLYGWLLLAAPCALILAWKYLLEIPIRRLYSPRGGGWLLLGTWALALAVIPLAYSLRSAHSFLGGSIAILAIPAALFATLVYRDQRHVAAGQDPITVIVPTRLGIGSRIVWGLTGVATTAVTAFLAFASKPDWEVIISVASLGVTLLGIAWKGTVPKHVREALGAPAEPRTPLDAG